MSGRNRFNNISSKEWLPFQKSWIKDVSIYDLYRSYIRFFLKFDHETNQPFVFYSGDDFDAFNKIAMDEGAIAITNLNELEKGQKIQLVFIDLLNDLRGIPSVEMLIKLRNKTFELVKLVKHFILDRRFLTIFCKNYSVQNNYLPFVWDLSGSVSQLLSLKDEKIWCSTKVPDSNESKYFFTQNNISYILHFRNDENNDIDYGLFSNSNFF